MNFFYWFILRRIARRLVVQGPEHELLITGYYRIMWMAAREQFTEDNRITLVAFLDECYQKSIEEEV